MTGSVPRRALLALLAALALAWFCNLGYRHLVKPDEGRYAEIPREMIASGDWVTPRINGYKYFEKPPLQYWATAVSLSAFGMNEWAARLWPGLTGFLGVLLVFWAGNRLFGAAGGPPGRRGGGELGAVRRRRPPAHAGHGAQLLHVRRGVRVRRRAAGSRTKPGEGAGCCSDGRRWRSPFSPRDWSAWCCRSPRSGIYVLVQRDWKLLARLRARPRRPAVPRDRRALVRAGVASPTRSSPRFFFIHEHFERFLTKEHDRYQPAWYFIPVLLIGIVPWIVALLPALRSAWRRGEAAAFDARRFLLLWCAVVFVFFSVSDSKLVAYILPLFPALALLIGDYLRIGGPAACCSRSRPSPPLLGIALAAAAPFAPDYASDAVTPALLEGYVPWLLAAGLALAAGGALATILVSRGMHLSAVLSLACGGLTLSQLALSGHESLAPSLSAYHIVQQIRNQVKPDVPFYFVETFDHTALFYLGRNVTMVANMDELADPIGREPGDFLPDAAAFARAWEADRDAFAMFNINDLQPFLKAHPLAMRVVAEDPRRVIVRKP